MADLKERMTSALRATEKYTGTDMVYLASGSFWAGISSVLQALIAFATALAFANLIPKETYGTYQYVLVVADLFGIFVLGGVDTALGRSVARGMDGSLFAGLRTKVRWGLVGGAGAIAFGAYYLAHANPLLGWAFVIAGICIPFWEAPGIYVTYLQGKKRFKFGFLADTGAQGFAAVVVIATLFLTNDLLIILASYLASWGIARVIVLWVSLRNVPPNDTPDPGMIPYGKHLTVMSAVGTFASSADDILLWHFLGPTAVALYIFAQTIPIRAAGVIKTVNRLAYPKFAATDDATLKRTLPRKVFLLFGVAAGAAVAYVLLAPYLFAWFFPQYLAAVPYSQLVAALIAMQPFNLFSSALSAQAKIKALYIYQFAIPGTRIALMAVLIPTLGLLGAVLALVLTDVVDSIVATVLFYKM
jgi:O-antigen/teichoic acid export membrane protein